MSIQQIENQESALSVRNKLNQVIDFVNQMGTDVAQKISALEQKAWLFDFFENNFLHLSMSMQPNDQHML